MKDRKTWIGQSNEQMEKRMDRQSVKRTDGGRRKIVVEMERQIVKRMDRQSEGQIQRRTVMERKNGRIERDERRTNRWIERRTNSDEWREGQSSGESMDRIDSQMDRERVKDHWKDKRTDEED